MVIKIQKFQISSFCRLGHLSRRLPKFHLYPSPNHAITTTYATNLPTLLEDITYMAFPFTYNSTLGNLSRITCKEIASQDRELVSRKQYLTKGTQWMD